MTKSSPLEGVETLIVGHVFRRLRVEEADVGSTVARMRRDFGSKRIYLQAEGEHVIRAIPRGHAAAKDLADLGRTEKVYVLFVEENGTVEGSHS